MSASAYNCKLGRGPMGQISAPKARASKVLKTASGSNFRGPTASQKAFSSHGGSKK